MGIDQARITDFISERPTRQRVASVVRRAGFQITVVRQEMPQVWGMYLKPNRQLSELLGTHREVLLWASEFGDFQARTVSTAQERISRDQPRLSNDFAFVLTPHDDVEKLVAEVADGLSTAFIGISLSHVHDFEPLGRQRLISYIQQRLFARDLYWISTAITNPRSFYGRKDILAEITALLKSGTSNIGVFGLRKIGKTSLLYQVLAALRQGKSTFVGHVDLQRLDTLYPNLDGCLWALGEALADGNPPVRRLSGRRLIGMHSLFSDAPRKSLPELFDHDIRLILKKSRRRIVLLFDEIELMSPTTKGCRWGTTFVDLWRLLRGLQQQYQGRFAFLVTGTNPKCIETNLLDGLENPAYNFFEPRYLPALESEECRRLLQDQGHLMGLRWDDAACEYVTGLVGGHPFLLRALASTVHRENLPRPDIMTITSDRVRAQVNTFMERFNPHLTQMLDVLREYYRDEFHMLEMLSGGRLSEFKAFAKDSPELTAHLKGYGVLSSREGEPDIAVQVLQSWFQRRIQTTRDSQSESPLLSPGATVDDYTIEARIGHAGAFSHVYRARASDGRIVALKVLRDGKMTSLQRELDAIRSTSHPCIVEFLSFGRTPDDQLYIAMEYLPGHSLREYCERTQHLSARSALRVLERLSDALVELHPNMERLETLRSVEVGDFQQIARARHGYVHRDIKPENVILVSTDRPVLIDFNISSQVADPVLTRSYTPGYRPPDGYGASWDPDVDLYALGVTMLQASLGTKVEAESIADARRLASSRLPGALSSVLLRMTHPYRRNRYHSASDLHTEVVRAKGLLPPDSD